MTILNAAALRPIASLLRMDRVSPIQHVISYAGLSLAILFVKLPPEQTSRSGSSGKASVGASHRVRSAIFWVTGGRWGFRQTHHVLVTRMGPAGNGSNERKDVLAKFQVNSRISAPGARSSVLPTET